MIEEFGLATEPLLRLATIVRGADTARLDLAPQAAGLLAASLGLSRLYADDLKQLDAGMTLYDAFYLWCRDATEEVHNWPNRRGGVVNASGGGGRLPRRRHPTFREAAKVWATIGLLSFGGPAGQIALMHKMLVEERKWISEARFLHALNFCMLLPGPEAQQLATYVGWLLHGTRGGIVAGTLFVLPGLVIILALSTLYAVFHETGWLESLFFGLKAAVLAIVIDAVIRIGTAGAEGTAGDGASRRPPSSASSSSACRFR